MAKKRWQDLSKGEKALTIVLASIQVSMAATAWADLATRPAAEVNGKKSVWAAVIGINFLGPILYFTRGRRRPR